MTPYRATHVHLLDANGNPVAITNAAPAAGDYGLAVRCISGCGSAVGAQDVNITQVGGVATTMGQKVMASSWPVVIASDQGTITIAGTVTVTDGAGALNVIVDSGTITSITNPVTITDGAGALNVIVDSGSITATASGNFENSSIDATGTTVPANATFVAGTDGTNTRAIKTDTTGTVQVDIESAPTGANAQHVQGAGAYAGAIVGNPVIIGGSDSVGATRLIRLQPAGEVTVATTITGADNVANTTLKSTQDQTGATGPLSTAPMLYDGSTWDRAPGNSAGGAYVQGAAAAAAAPVGNPVQVGGTDGAAMRTLLTSAAGRAQVAPVFALAGGDGVANTVGYSFSNADGAAPAVVAPMLLNGSGTLDQQRGNTSGSYVQGPAADAAAIAGNPVRMGGTDGTNIRTVFVDPCQREAKTYTPIDIVTATTTAITTATASQRVYICSITLFAAGTQNAAVVEGTGGTCGTGTAGVMGGATAGKGFNFTAQTGIAFGNGQTAIAATAGANVDLCIITSAAVQLSGVVTWVKEP